MGRTDPIACRTRDLPREGITRDTTRGKAWSSPTTGVHRVTGVDDSLISRCRAVQLALPADAVYTHLTAAALRDWWLPVGLLEVPMIASTIDDAPHHDRRGCYVRRCRVPDGHRSVLDGVRIASAAWTIAELAEHLSLIDLTATIDCARHRKEVSLPELWAVCVKGRRGVRTLRQAIRLSDERSESYWETVLRLLHVLSGIHDIHPQAVMLDAAGRFVARADLRLGTTRRLHEYDGGIHREKEVHQSDLDRSNRLSRARYDRRGYTSAEITSSPMQIIEDAEHALGLSHDPSRLATWWYEAQRSSVLPESRRRLRGRLRRFERSAAPRARRAAQPATRAAQDGAESA